MKFKTDSLGRRIDGNGYAWVTCETCGKRFAWLPDRPDPPCNTHHIPDEKPGDDMAKTNSREIRERKAKREAKEGKKSTKPVEDAPVPRAPKQLSIPGTVPKVHKDVEALADKYRDALKAKKVRDKQLETARDLLVLKLKERKLDVYKYLDVEIELKKGVDSIRIRELDKDAAE